MKTNDPVENHEAPGETLHEWPVTTPLPPRFEENVWRRIALAEARVPAGVWARLSRWVASVLPRPAVAASYLSVVLVVGVMAGYWQGHSKVARWHESLGLRYVQSVDPYQNPRP